MFVQRQPDFKKSFARAQKIKARDMEDCKEHEFARAQKIKARDMEDCKEHDFARAQEIKTRSQIRS